MSEKFCWAVFVSGEGTNLQHFLDLEKSSLKKNQIAAVVADRECKALERAKKAGKSVLLCPPSDQSDQQMLSFLQDAQIDAIFLLGYMRILKPGFLSSWKKKIVNLHPSLLPLYKGAKAVEKAFAAGEKSFGVSLHEVVEEVDAGAILRQLSFPRPQNATLNQVFDEIHAFERKIVGDYLFDLERSAGFRKDEI